MYEVRFFASQVVGRWIFVAANMIQKVTRDWDSSRCLTSSVSDQIVDSTIALPLKGRLLWQHRFEHLSKSSLLQKKCLKRFDLYNIWFFPLKVQWILSKKRVLGKKNDSIEKNSRPSDRFLICEPPAEKWRCHWQPRKSHHSEPTKKPQIKTVSTSYSFSEKLLNIIQHIGFFCGILFWHGGISPMDLPFSKKYGTNSPTRWGRSARRRPPRLR